MGVLVGVISGFLFVPLSIQGAAITTTSNSYSLPTLLTSISCCCITPGFFIGLIVGLLKVNKFGNERIELVEAINWSWSTLRKEVHKEFRDMILRVRTPGALNDLFNLYMYFGLVKALYGGIEITELEERTSYGQGVRRSIRNAVIISLIGVPYGFLLGFLMLFFFGNTASPAIYGFTIFEEWLLNSSLITFLLTLIFGLRFGAFAYIKHKILRLLLVLNGYTPLQLRSFLDYCVDHILLRKVGGGYIFIHRLLLDYFSSLTEEDINRLAAEIETEKVS